MYINLKYNYINNSFNNLFPHKIELDTIIGEGSSCIVYNFINDFVIKIYKKSNNIKYFNNILSELNDNNELFNNNYNLDGLNEFKFFYKYLEKIDHDNIAIPYAYGLLKKHKKYNILNISLKNNKKHNSKIKEDNSDIKEESNNNELIDNKYYMFIILPLFKPLNNFNLIKKEKYLIKLIYIILSVESYIQTNFNITNLDIKLDNILIDNNNDFKIIDFGLILNININNVLDNKNNYFIWPKKPSKINKICLYSIFLLIYQILFKNIDDDLYKQIHNFDNSNNLLNNIKNNYYYSDNFIFLLENLLHMNFDIDYYKQFINNNFFNINSVSDFYNQYFIEYFSKYKLK